MLKEHYRDFLEIIASSPFKTLLTSRLLTSRISGFFHFMHYYKRGNIILANIINNSYQNGALQFIVINIFYLVISNTLNIRIQYICVCL